MNRREALKVAGAVIVGSKATVLGFDFKPRSEYVVFFDKKMMGETFPDDTVRKGFPPDTVFHPVEVPPGKTLDDAIRIFSDR